MSTATITETKTDAYGFPVVTCYRCGGSGHFSYNARTGTTCFGCNGSGICWKRGKVAKAAVEFHKARRAKQNPVMGNLVAGDIIACNDEGQTNGTNRSWWTFESMVIDYSQVTGSSKNFTTGEYEPVAWKTTMILRRIDADAVERTLVVKSQTNVILKGKATLVDATPYLVAAGVKKEN